MADIFIPFCAISFGAIMFIKNRTNAKLLKPDEKSSVANLSIFCRALKFCNTMEILCSLDNYAGSLHGIHGLSDAVGYHISNNVYTTFTVSLISRLIDFDFEINSIDPCFMDIILRKTSGVKLLLELQELGYTRFNEMAGEYSLDGRETWLQLNFMYTHGIIEQKPNELLVYTIYRIKSGYDSDQVLDSNSIKRMVTIYSQLDTIKSWKLAFNIRRCVRKSLNQRFEHCDTMHAVKSTILEVFGRDLCFEEENPDPMVFQYDFRNMHKVIFDYYVMFVYLFHNNIIDYKLGAKMLLATFWDGVLSKACNDAIIQIIPSFSYSEFVDKCYDALTHYYEGHDYINFITRNKINISCHMEVYSKLLPYEKASYQSVYQILMKDDIQKKIYLFSQLTDSNECMVCYDKLSLDNIAFYKCDHYLCVNCYRSWNKKCNQIRCYICR